MKRLLIALVRFYRRNISPWRPPCCRYIRIQGTREHEGRIAMTDPGAVRQRWSFSAITSLFSLEIQKGFPRENASL